MGNFAVGRQMGSLVKVMVERRLEGETAIQILDAAAEMCELNGTDAEFEDDKRTDQPLGRIIFEAFAPNGADDIAVFEELETSIDDGEVEDEALDEAQAKFDELYEATYGAFSKRYDLH